MFLRNNEPKYFISITEGTNSAQGFFEFIINICESNFVTDGNNLIVDNARIHKDEEILPQIDDLLKSYSSDLLFLPTYSPEVNFPDFFFLF